jgi:hypothetical protein
MAYTKTVWVDNTTPAINASNLNKMEQGIFDAHGFLAPTAFQRVATWNGTAYVVNGVVVTSSNRQANTFYRFIGGPDPAGLSIGFGSGDEWDAKKADVTDRRFTGYSGVATAKTAAFTLTPTEVGALTPVTAATGVTVTAPTPTSLSVPLGQIATLIQRGAGQITIAAGTGVTLSSSLGTAAGAFRTRTTNSRLDLIAFANTEWLVEGDADI